MIWFYESPTCLVSSFCRSHSHPARALRSLLGRWCWCPGVAARAGPGTEPGSAWPAWHSAAAPSEGAAGWPAGGNNTRLLREIHKNADDCFLSAQECEQCVPFCLTTYFSLVSFGE